MVNVLRLGKGSYVCISSYDYKSLYNSNIVNFEDSENKFLRSFSSHGYRIFFEIVKGKKYTILSY